MSISFQNVLIPDFQKNEFYKASVKIENGRIAEISDSPLTAETVIDGQGGVLSPGLIDCHCHIESSLLPPEEFGNSVMQFGTLHVIADCHEITNIAGPAGLKFFFDNSEGTNCRIRFAIPSCVPATPFAMGGGVLTLEDISSLMDSEKVVALGEIMNVPAALNRDPHIIGMIEAAKKHDKIINGHAPHLGSENLKKYISVGIMDDHESETYAELKEKIECGLRVFLREGSAEQTEDAAYKIIAEHPDRVMFCTDDKSIHHILQTGHINYHLAKAVKNGVDPLAALKTASYNGLKYYGMDEYAEVKTGNPAHLVLFEDMKNFKPRTVVANGKIFKKTPATAEIPDFIRYSFDIKPVKDVPAVEEKIKKLCIGVTDGSLVTERMELTGAEENVLKIAVFNRYGKPDRYAANIKGFGLKKGALASSVAHDCHNIVAVGVSDEAIIKAVNAVIAENGGLAVYDGNVTETVPLHIGGIVSDRPAEVLNEKLEKLKNIAHGTGCGLTSPFDTLSFMCLEVIPHLKITYAGLFDVDKFGYI